ncbi:hypothetical protein FOMPIDRAFT_89929 [Fomitopsis schrenkii]|uniref:Uncharacterized protein n=1 Tax=Fomitopsis schrenkii TaxID=2126942 RepID=S8E3I8_FOMSC|nr:hypothetical protein FOMPIDRAFT_89929 [Fomitopsis schrenkii]
MAARSYGHSTDDNGTSTHDTAYLDLNVAVLRALNYLESGRSASISRAAPVAQGVWIMPIFVAVPYGDDG